MNGKWGLKQVYAFYLLWWLTLTSRYPIGTNIFEQDWDLLIVLDACRVDALQSIKSEYDFIDDVGSVWSVGSTSREWIEGTFTHENEEILSKCAYITGNPFSDVLIGKKDEFNYGAITNGVWLNDCNFARRLVKSNIVDGKNMGHLEILQSKDHGTVDPRTITDHTIRVNRSRQYRRIISHYMQPHLPYYSSAEDYSELRGYEKSPFEKIRNGDVSKESVWDSYIDNLRYVLDDIELLVNNVNGNVIITADHGELFGECGMYSHQAGNFHPHLRKVPWVKLSASDENTHQPEVELSGIEQPEEISNDQLRALGYL